MEWWQSFFDESYLQVWGGMVTMESSKEQADGLWWMLGLEPGQRVLDAPCGFGRISRPLAERGALVLGVDQSQAMIDEAERQRGGLSPMQLGYRTHDLRTPLAEDDFDVALNIFSSLGYGSEEEDLAILITMRRALKKGGRLVVETMHRDAFVARLALIERPANRLPDGTLLVEEPHFDALAGRVSTRWTWFGPRGHGEKSASLRMYSATELVRLIERAGLTVRGSFRGCSTIPFAAAGRDLGGRLAIVAEA